MWEIGPSLQRFNNKLPSQSGFSNFWGRVVGVDDNVDRGQPALGREILLEGAGGGWGLGCLCLKRSDDDVCLLSSILVTLSRRNR